LVGPYAQFIILASKRQRRLEMKSKKVILKSASRPSQKVSKEPAPESTPKPKQQPPAPTPKPVPKPTPKPVQQPPAETPKPGPKPAHKSKQQPSALTPKTTKKRLAAKIALVFKEGALKREQHPPIKREQQPPKNIPIRLTKQNKEK